MWMSYEVHFGGNTHICNAKKLKTVLIFGEVMDGYILYFKMAAMNKPTFAVWIKVIFGVDTSMIILQVE